MILMIVLTFCLSVPGLNKASQTQKEVLGLGKKHDSTARDVSARRSEHTA